MIQSVHFTRPLAAAKRLADFAEDHHRFVEKSVLLTGESAILFTANGRACFMDSLRLLIRICRNVSVAIPGELDRLTVDCRDLAGRICFDTQVEFTDPSVDQSKFDAILSVGTAVNPDFPWTTINSNGWLARVSSGDIAISRDCGQHNPIGALGAAALGTAEVFKRLIRLKPSRGRLLNGFCFSLFSYSEETADPGPPIYPDPDVDVLLFGAGALGNGTAHLLSQLPKKGRVTILDREAFQVENLGTCILIGPSELGIAKAEFVATVLKDKYDVTAYPEELDVFLTRLGESTPHPRLVLGGVDSGAARRSVQALWPDLIIDGAIGDFLCQASVHPWDDDTACLLCMFKEPPGEPADSMASRLTGLNMNRIQEAMTAVSDTDIQDAPAEKREWLTERKGRQVCSLVREAVAQELSKERLRENFQPSIPFVACLSSCMVVAELVKELDDWDTQLEPRFQFDVLRGPQRGLLLPEARHKNCLCVTRRHNIDWVRKNRSQESELRRRTA